MTIRNDVTLADLLWYKIGGKTKYLIECKNKQDILDAFAFIHKEKIERYFVVGMGANLLFTDDYFDGAVIQIKAPDTPQIVVNDNELTAFAGITLDDVINAAFDHQLIGLEWAGGLPSTIGAAIRGNVGAFGHSIRESVKEVEVFDVTSDATKMLSVDELDFSYRNSLIKLHRNLIVLSTTFALNKASSEELG